MQPVGQLDDHHADVERHRDQHLAQALGGAQGFGPGGLVSSTVEPHALFELGDALHQLHHVLPKLGAHLRIGDLGVLDDIVEEGGDDAIVIEPKFEADQRDFNGVGDVGFATAAELAIVGGRGQVHGRHNARVLVVRA